ncbi:MAG TPA: S-layer homology domain-containing protein [Candidatus Eisenbergiella merdigallinarum]|uniref:S-layer homology domain-containing protein n=1 Tax=Candidatus Eisenbergiella merdigallinarum TaxID=2838552 RepID=A0A9D2SCD1_9FIRM|nr:S-layer homology domain-containing protein [Candidatus Eisenbergiella merdigallinarum]
MDIGGAVNTTGVGGAGGTVIILTNVTTGGDSALDIGAGSGSGTADNGAGIKPGTVENTYEIYGSLSLPADLTIPASVTVNIPQKTTLTVPSDKTLTNYGTITGDGTLTIQGDAKGNGSVSVSGFNKKDQTNAPSDPSGTSAVTANSVTLTAVTDSGGVGGIQYGYTTGAGAMPENWQTETTFTNLSPGTTYTFYARYAGNGFYAPSAASSTGLTVTTSALVDAETPNITTHPQGGTYTVGADADLSVTASVNDGGTLSYQWYSSTTDSTTGGSEISGATSSSYTPPTSAAGTTWYYCVVTNTNNSATGEKTATAISNTAGVIVNPAPVTTYTVTVNGGTGGGSYQEGVTVTITATVPSGKQFAGWTVTAGGVTLADANSAATTFTMPAGNVTVTANFEDTPPQPAEYTITFDGNGGTSPAAQTTTGQKLTSLPTSTQSGYSFNGWYTAKTGGDKITPDTVFSASVTVYAQWTEDTPPQPAEYTITFDGNGGTSPAAQTTTGQKLTSLPTSTQSGYSFNGWYTAKTGGDKITPDTVFSASVTVYAQWTKNSEGGGSSSGGSSGGSGSSSSSGGGSGSDSGSSGSSAAVSRPDPNATDTPATGQTAPVEPGADGSASISSSTVQDAINKAAADAKKNGNTGNGIAVTVPIQNAADAGSLAITIPAGTLDELVSAKVRRFDITTNGLTSFGFTLDTLKMLDTQSQGGDLVLRMVKTAVASNEAKEAVGTRPAYDISLVYVKGGVETPLTDWQGRTISVKLPYTPAANEQAGNLCAVCVDGNGKAEWLAKSSYDPDQKAVLFEAEHFGIYGVGYRAPAEAFTDISGHWAGQHILFAAGRGLIDGAGDGRFAPDAGMTRGMFVTALGRLAGIDPADYRTGQFTDVPEDAWYAPYVNWAAQNGIVSGAAATGPATFSPDSGIVREEMAVILKNYAAKMGYTLPGTLKAVTFTDRAQISSWAADAVRAMQQAGILAGKDGGRFDPKGTATRAEVAIVLHRFVEVVIDPQTANGWAQNDSGDWYYYRGGEPVKGWLSDEQKWYWLDQSSGKMFAGGWKQIGGGQYYFHADGVMAVNAAIEGYAIGPDGRKTA